MSSCSSDEGGSTSTVDQNKKNNKYKGIRCRKWGKWVSEIRVPGTQDRLWLGSYSTPEAAAVAHDIASYCLRGSASLHKLNFPASMLPATARTDLSPRSIQKVASYAAMAVDAQFSLTAHPPPVVNETGRDYNYNDQYDSNSGGSSWHGLTISVEDYL